MKVAMKCKQFGKGERKEERQVGREERGFSLACRLAMRESSRVEVEDAEQGGGMQPEDVTEIEIETVTRGLF